MIPVSDHLETAINAKLFFHYFHDGRIHIVLIYPLIKKKKKHVGGGIVTLHLTGLLTCMITHTHTLKLSSSFIFNDSITVEM